MKYVKRVLLFVVVSMMMANTTRNAKISEGITPGSRAPEIHHQHLSLTGKYTLLQFWATYDATSRANNALITNRLSRIAHENVQMISVSFDEKVSVFEETVKIDKLDLSTQFNIPQGRKSEIFKNFRLSDGFGNMLIDPHGVILAVNISHDKLQEALNAI
jgi:hypothetical protein